MYANSSTLMLLCFAGAKLRASTADHVLCQDMSKVSALSLLVSIPESIFGRGKHVGRWYLSLMKALLSLKGL